VNRKLALYLQGWTLLSVKILRIRKVLLFRRPVFNDKTECNFFTERYFLLYTEYCAMCEVAHTTTYAIHEKKTYTIKRNSKADVCVNGPYDNGGAPYKPRVAYLAHSGSTWWCGK
jgi:hypothetical protein